MPEKSTLHGDPGVHLDARIMLGIATLQHGAKVEEYRSLHTTLRVLTGRATHVTPRQNSLEPPPQVCKYVEGDGAAVMHVPSHSVPDDKHSLMATFFDTGCLSSGFGFALPGAGAGPCAHLAAQGVRKTTSTPSERSDEGKHRSEPCYEQI